VLHGMKFCLVKAAASPYVQDGAFLIRFILTYPTLERLLLMVLKRLPTIGSTSTRTPITA